MRTRTTRRAFLRTGAAACCAAASPLVTPVVLAAAPTEQRLVVILLRGAMDGLDAVRPHGDPDFATLRQGFADHAPTDATDLDGFFTLHPALAPLAPLWAGGELAFAHAVSTPYRDKRSHFDGQDALENGAGAPDGQLTSGRDGWLNRMLSLMPGAEARTALAVGRERLMLLSGAAPVAGWAPETEFDLSADAWQALERLYARDRLFREASIVARSFERVSAGGTRGSSREEKLASFTAGELRGETRLAAFSLGGWDTHKTQNRDIRRPLAALARTLLTLKTDLGPVWQRTGVICLTEFGRTARENGSGGTDHGTGGACVMAGGTLAGARVHGRWPGLAEADLYQRRDLMPTEDVRRYAAWMLRGLFGIGAGDLTRTIFPGLDLGPDPKLIA